jgi:hypothetical protein
VFNSFTDGALPNVGRALELRHSLNEGLKQSLLHILEALSEIPDFKYFNSFAEHLTSLDPGKKISSLYYMLNGYIVNAIEQDDIEKVKTGLDNANYLLNEPQDHLKVYCYEDIPLFFQQIFLRLASFDLLIAPHLFATDEKLLTQNKQTLSKAMDIAKQYAPDIYEEAYAFISSVMFVQGDNIKAGSSVGALGLIYIEQRFAPTPLEMLDIFVHEAAHQYLHGVSFEDELVLNPPEERYEAPLRKEKRPLSGIYHAAFVLARIIYTFDKILQSDCQSLDRELLEAKKEHYKLRYSKGCEILYKYANLTPRGKVILDSTSMLVG